MDGEGATQSAVDAAPDSDVSNTTNNRLATITTTLPAERGSSGDLQAWSDGAQTTSQSSREEPARKNECG